MKIKPLLLFLFLISGSSLFAQLEMKSRPDTAGKKQGEYIVYLDQYWKEVQNKNEAVFSRITYYENGVNVYPMGPCGRKNWTLKISNPDSLNKKSSGFLNGEYKWFDENGKLVSEHHFQNGKYVSCKEYYKSGELHQHFDYSRTYKFQPFTYFVYLYEKTGKKTIYVMRNGKYGWMLYQTSESDL